MAAVAHSPFGLQPPAADDTMEISSNFGGDMDGDIDIDFDSAGEQMQYDEDDQMIDDAKPENMQYPEHVDEDVMVDDDAASNSQDRVMQDSPPHQEHDEELLDFSDNEDMPIEPAEHVTFEETAPETQPSVLESIQSEAAAELLTEGVEPVDHLAQTVENDLDQLEPEQTEPGEIELASQHTDDAELEEHSKSEDAPHHTTAPEVHGPQSEEHVQDKHVEVPLQELSHTDVFPSEDDLHAHTDESTEQPTVQTSETYEVQEETTGEDPTESAAGNASEESRPSQSAPLHLDTELSQAEEAEDVDARERQPDSPTVTGLHPTIVEYDGNEIFLFPSREPASFEQYLLQNENLVTSSLGDLLQACRVVLGESISEDEELVLGVEELDLYVSEDSTPAFSTSFSELLDIYMKLHQHDGNDHPPAFRVTLTTKTRFTNRLTTITQAIAEGKGFSQLPFLEAYNEFEGITELPDPDEDFDEEDYLEVDERHSHVPEQQNEDENTHEYVDNNDANEALAQQDRSDTTTASGQAGIEEQSGDQEGLDPTDVGDYQLGEYEEAATVEQPEHRNEADHGHDATQTEGLQEETLYLDAEGERLNDDVFGVDGETLQQESTDEHSNVVTEGATNVDVLSNVQLQSTTLDASLTAQTAENETGPPETTTGTTESAAHESTEQEENLFDGEADDDYGNAREDYAASEAPQATEDSKLGTIDTTAYTGSTGSGFHNDENQEAGQHDFSFVNNGDDLTASEPTGAVPDDAKEDSTTLDNSTGDVNDLDEIDFDDEDDYVNEYRSVNTSLDTEPAKLSPPGKRSFSDRATEGEVDEDGQALKRVRSS